MAKQLTITVTDPATIELLAQYRRFIESEDGTKGTITEVVEGLIVGCMDDHQRFAMWRRNNNGKATATAAAPANVTPLPAISQIKTGAQIPRRRMA